jgi:glutathione S-transferase
MSLPILYSYRRCPYAMRARMALWAAQIQVELREVSLREKPQHLLQISPKATVPVLQSTDGIVLEQSLDIMRWALQQNDTHGWLKGDMAMADALISVNDGEFKKALDRYKYPERYPEQLPLFYRQQGEQFLQRLEALLTEQRFLLDDSASIADVAIFPFIRQFAAVDAEWFAHSSYSRLREWLAEWMEGELFAEVMQKFPTYTES